jgi:peptidyl-prolyl cis-trans isomerase B (cyclophilin B)
MTLKLEFQNPVVTINMDNGQIIKIELFPKTAPNTVNNFITLVKQGYYNDLTFHRIIPGFMIQGGCPLGTGTGGPGYAIKGEFSYNHIPNDLKHTQGVISMARAMHPDSAGSQFFIMVADAPHLDGQYAAFGKVIEGMDVALNLAEKPRNRQDRPEKPLIMRTVTVDTFREVYPEPEKI